MNLVSFLVKDSDPRAFPRLKTTSSLRSSKATPRISFALNIFWFKITAWLYLFNNLFGLYKKINIDRINSNLIEAAEQCNFNNIPEVSDAVNFNHILDNWEKFFEDRKVIFCDERSKSEALEVLKDKKNKYNNKWAIIVGPEGGFSDFERNSIDNKNNSLSISLWPRVMRSDTAVVAILAIFQMIIGDWKK